MNGHRDVHIDRQTVIDVTRNYTEQNSMCDIYLTCIVSWVEERFAVSGEISLELDTHTLHRQKEWTG